MSPAKKRAMIERDHPELSITQQCKLVWLSRSAFYYTPVGINADTLAMMKESDRVFTKYPFFGSRQIAAYLRREGAGIIRSKAMVSSAFRPQHFLLRIVRNHPAWTANGQCALCWPNSLSSRRFSNGLNAMTLLTPEA